MDGTPNTLGTPCEIRLALLAFLARELELDGDDDEQLDEHTPLLAWGIISSLTMASLLTFIRERFEVHVQSDSVTVENFENVAAITAMVEAHRAGEVAAPTASTITSEWHDLRDDRRMHCLSVRGQAEPPWVLLPGLGNSASSWTGVLAALAGEREALAVDLVGFGVSTGADDLDVRDHCALLDELLERRFGQREVVLVASSAGSLIALERARRHPKSTAALVLVGFGLIPEPQAWLAGLERLWQRPEQFLECAYFRPPRLDEALRTQIAATTTGPAFRAFLRPGDLDAAAFAGIRVPTLFVAGREDRIVGIDAIRAGAEQIPGASFVELARCGHLPGTEQPDETIDSIEAFMREAGISA